MIRKNGYRFSEKHALGLDPGDHAQTRANPTASEPSPTPHPEEPAIAQSATRVSRRMRPPRLTLASFAQADSGASWFETRARIEICWKQRSYHRAPHHEEL